MDEETNVAAQHSTEKGSTGLEEKAGWWAPPGGGGYRAQREEKVSDNMVHGEK